ncbi:MAG: ABC transporter substrate-binding protein [Blautia sp.]|nr:ABC transporter substrate-binding protein [Blautia sp.]
MKKTGIMALLLAGTLAVLPLTAWGAEEEYPEWDDDPAEVTWYMWNLGGTATPEGIEAVEEALNEITLPKINVEVDLEILEMGTYLTQMAMEVSAGEKIDLISTFPAMAGSYAQMLASNQLMPLDDLLEEEAPELLETVPDEVLKATRKNGVTYAVPIYNDQRNDYYWLARTSVLEEAGIDPESIHDYKDITEVFEKVHEIRPDLKMVSTAGQNLTGQTGALLNGTLYDNIGSNVAAVMVEEDAAKVVCLFETEEYKETVHILNEWYEAGYIDMDAPIRQDAPTTDRSVFSEFLGGNPTRTLTTDSAAGEPITKVKLAEGPISTGVATIMTMAIPVSATEPEGAARLMNLCYTDPTVKNLVSYGIEGVDYTLNEDGAIVKADNALYNPNSVGIFGNQFLAYPTVEEVNAGIASEAVNPDDWYYSPLYGFSIDLEPISALDAQIQSVYGEYNATIACGFGTDETYQEYIDKLYASGLQEYLDELQRQLDEYLAQ